MCVRKLDFSVEANGAKNLKLCVIDLFLEFLNLPGGDSRKYFSLTSISYFLGEAANLCQVLENDRLLSRFRCEQKTACGKFERVKVLFRVRKGR